MLRRLGRLTVRRPKTVLGASVLFFALAAFFGGPVAESLTSGGFDDPASESAEAEAVIEDTFGAGEPNVILLVTAGDGGGVDDPEVAAAGAALTEELAAEPGVTNVASYWSLGNVPPLRSDDGTQAMVLGMIDGSDDRVRDRIEELSPEYTRTDGTVTVGVGGFAEVFRQIGGQIERDLTKAELIAIPITLVLLVLVFGSIVAAGLPLGVGALAVVGAFLVLRVIASVTDVSIFALNLTTAMGLGLAIDYSLFIVSRYREELRGGLAPDDAVVRTVETAGKTVAFSALTVAVSLAALLVFPLAFLRSFAYAGTAVALVAMGGAIVTLPALLAVLGRRVDKWVVWHHAPKTVGEGFWHRIATTVMRRPVPVAAGVVALLFVLGLPFLHIEFGLPDDRALPAGASSREVHEDLRTNFSSNEAAALQVVATGLVDVTDADVDAYASSLSELDGVARVDARTGSYADGALVLPPGDLAQRFVAPAATWLSVVPSVEPMSADAEALVAEVRAADSPFEIRVTGPSAELTDLKDSLFARMPLAIGLIALATFVLLFLMFGSVVVPLKALVINVLSLSATFGAMVWIFQDGHLAGLLDFTPTGTLDTTTPILMFCVAFGLSMDYEVFLLSRIKEEYDQTHDNTSSVAVGLERTGRIVTAAAVLISVVFLAFATSSVTFIKLFGVGLAVAVLMDAFVIRATLVPAFMRLAGSANWWAPRPLRRFHDRFGISEHEPAAAPEQIEDRVAEPVGTR
ncbi:MAG TPA: MMPL family transporter [Acidimicrobiia bacterium]